MTGETHCMKCGAEGAKEYHSQEKINNKEHFASHIVRCERCYDFITHELWPDECDCFEGGKD